MATSDNLRSNGSTAGETSRTNREEAVENLLQQLRQVLSGLRFGQVVITVQDGLPIQIERTEKTRLR